MLQTARPDRDGCPGTVHGSASAYDHHGCTCPDSRAAYAAYERGRVADRAAGRPRFLPGSPTRTRVAEIVALTGWTVETVARRAGVARTTLQAIARDTGGHRVQRRNAERVEALHKRVTLAYSGREHLRYARPVTAEQAAANRRTLAAEIGARDDYRAAS